MSLNYDQVRQMEILEDHIEVSLMANQRRLSYTDGKAKEYVESHINFEQKLLQKIQKNIKEIQRERIKK